jgi:murein L,D-transpeptidase YcbB/YkuD
MTRSSVKGRMPRVLGSAALAVALAAGMAGVSAAGAAGAAGAAAAGPEVTAAYALTAAAGLSWPELRQGSNSAWPKATVRSLQYLLNAHGAKLTVDGVFGPKTKAAVVTFQHAKGLTASGVVQASTWRALVVTVHRGSAGPAVRAVQDQINFRNLKDGRTLTVDGLFGPKTEASVRAFQRALAAEVAGFRVDGVVGPQTWQALVSEALSG